MWRREARQPCRRDGQIAACTCGFATAVQRVHAQIVTPFTVASPPRSRTDLLLISRLVHPVMTTCLTPRVPRLQPPRQPRVLRHCDYLPAATLTCPEGGGEPAIVLSVAR